jgi:hypothetical protein
MKEGGPEHFTPVIAKILGNLMPYPGRTSACHPSDLPAGDTRIQDLESPMAWLQRIAENTKHVDRLTLFPHIAFTAEIFWDSTKNGNVISKVHAQALILDGVTVEDVICGGKAERYQYLRADFDPGNLGRIFPDPMVHVHSEPKGEPRFSASVAITLPHVDFLELILRNYAKDIWNKWAIKVWERRIKPYLGNAEDPRARIQSAFGGNHHKVLRGDLREPLERWKQKLLEEKRMMSSLVYDPSFEALNY